MYWVNLYTSLNIIRMVVSKKMRWAKQLVFSMQKCIQNFDLETWKEDQLGDLGINMRIILEWILLKQGRKVWTGCLWLRLGSSARLLWRW